MEPILPSVGAVPPQLSSPVKVPRGEKAAREFEASLIASLLEQLEKTFADVPGAGGLAGSDSYNYLGTQALARGIADRGGFCIATLIARSFSTAEK